jgi:hypothetical protein
MNDTPESSAQDAGRAARDWLLLIHQLPLRPAYLRVKVRRRLQQLGAVPLKSSVYALPNTEEHREDFQWLANEIIGDGGEATICAATLLSGVTNEDLAPHFPELRVQRPGAPRSEPPVVPRKAVWVTRRDVFVDRIASAWLIRRFIDPDARFRFVPGGRARKREGEIRFDMYQGEFTHEGDRCTFETLLSRFALGDSALRAIGEIVHDIDLKDRKFRRAETAGVALMLKGITRATSDDQERVARGAAVFDALFDSLRAGVS